jgi:hypothetical protein
MNPAVRRRLLASVAEHAHGWVDRRLTLDQQRAVDMLHASNPEGRPNADVMRPIFSDWDLRHRPRGHWTVLDDFRLPQYELPLRHVLERRGMAVVYATRRRGRLSPRRLMALNGFDSDERVRQLEPWATDFAIDPRYLAVAARSNLMVFQWQDQRVLPDHTVVGFARREDYFFGVMQSRVQALWARAMIAELAPQVRPFRYIPGLCFDTFPFPLVSRSQRAAISKAARALDALRLRWLSPPDLVREETMEFPARHGTHGVVSSAGLGTGRYRFLKPVDRAAAAALEQRTIATLYTGWPEWLREAHRALDEAVLDGYGWNVSVKDDEILNGLRALNVARARPRYLTRALRSMATALGRLAPPGLDRHGGLLVADMARTIDLHALSGLPARDAIVAGIVEYLKCLEEHTLSVDVRDGVLQVWLRSGQAEVQAVRAPLD